MKILPRMALALCVSAWTVSYVAAQQLQCNPCSNDFGQVQVGASRPYTFQLTNSGSRALTIGVRRKTNKDFFFRQFPLPVTLRPGQGASMRVDFTPSAAGATSGTLILVSDALNPKLTITVSGTGVSTNAPTLGVTPASLTFGNVTLGSSTNLQLSLSASNGPVTISAAQTNSSEFSLTGLAVPQTIASGQSLTATVAFTPNASGTATSTLVLTSDAVNSPTAVPLTGVGVAVVSHSADLSWTGSTDVVVGYQVYRGGTKGGPYTKINPVLNASTSYTDNTVSAGATYYYVATAVDSSGVESGYSNETTVVVPNP